MQEVDRELKRQEEELTRRLRESEEEGRLGKEEMELRYISALGKNEKLRVMGKMGIGKKGKLH